MIHTLSLGALVTANVLVGLLVQGLILVFIGPGPDTDALFASLTIPQLVLLLTSGPAVRVLVPLFSAAAGDAATVGRDAWTFLHLVVGMVALAAVGLGATAPLWVALLFPGFAAPTHELTVVLTRVQLAGVVFTAASTVLAAFHQSRHRFVRVEVALLCCAVVSALVMVVAMRRFGVTGVAWTTLGQAAAQMLLLLPGLGRYHLPQMSSAAVALGGRRMVPLVAGALVYKNERVVDRLLASWAPRGDLSLLALGHQAYTASGVMLNRVVTGPLVPVLARHVSGGDHQAFRASCHRGLASVLALTAAAFLLTVVVGEPVLRLVVGRGLVTGDDIHRLWIILLALGGYLVAGGCGQVVSAAFYAQGDTATPTWIGIAAFTLSIPLRAAGLWAFGVPGIALGSSAYHVMNAVALLAILETRMNPRLDRQRRTIRPLWLPWRAE